MKTKNEDHVFMCRPCAEALNGVKIQRSVIGKGTCECCKRRRYGYLCEVKK